MKRNAKDVRQCSLIDNFEEWFGPAVKERESFYGVEMWHKQFFGVPISISQDPFSNMLTFFFPK